VGQCRDKHQVAGGLCDQVDLVTRRTYVTSLLRRGVDIHLVQRLLSHADIVTTVRYIHLSDTDLADAVDMVFPRNRLN